MSERARARVLLYMPKKLGPAWDERFLACDEVSYEKSLGRHGACPAGNVEVR